MSKDIKDGGRATVFAKFSVIPRVGTAIMGQSNEKREKPVVTVILLLARKPLLPLKRGQSWSFISVLSLPAEPSDLKGQLLVEHDTARLCAHPDTNICSGY